MSMGHEEIEDRVRAIVAALVLVDPGEVTPDRLLVDELELDSLGFVELTFSIEEELGVEFPDVKVSEEVSSLSLPEGVERLASMTGGTTLLEYIALEAAGRMGVSGTDLWQQTAETLARALGGNVPKAFDPGVPLRALRLDSLLRFLTVGTLIDYTQYLRRTH
jgi:acyl carrier protein